MLARQLAQNPGNNLNNNEPNTLRKLPQHTNFYNAYAMHNEPSPRRSQYDGFDNNQNGNSNSFSGPI
jgi:hypothetical protein